MKRTKNEEKRGNPLFFFCESACPCDAETASHGTLARRQNGKTGDLYKSEVLLFMKEEGKNGSHLRSKRLKMPGRVFAWSGKRAA